MLGSLILLWSLLQQPQSPPAPSPPAPSPQQPSAPPGNLVLKPPKLEFGEVDRDRRVVENVLITNIGTANVRVMSISGATKNMLARVLDDQGRELLSHEGRGSWNRLIAPGKNVTLEVTVNTTGVPSDTVKGRLTLYTDDPPATRVSLSVTANLRGPGPTPAPTAAGSTETRSGPRLKLDKTKIDFGTLIAGTDGRVQVVLTNAGTADLEIRKVTTSCGCTVPRLVTPTENITAAELEKGHTMKIAPKASAMLEAHLISNGLLGDLSKQISITTNDRGQSQHDIEVVAHVEKGYALKPSAFLFGQVQRGDAAKATLTLEATLLSDLVITEAVTPDPSFKVEVTKLDGPTLTYRIDANVAADAPAKALKAPVILKTNHPVVNEIMVPVVGELTDVVLFDLAGGQNERLDFGLLKEGQGAERDITIENLDPTTPYAVDKVEIDTKNVSMFKHEIITVEAGKKYRLRLSISTEMPRGYFTGTMIVHSSHPRLPKKEVKFLGFVGAK